ncbi:MAG: hypothetical protein PHW47_08030 [Lachnospira sp.]|nr:hypothetical protein [Lachnospira sp.]
MSEELVIIEKQLSAMATIFNLVPGEVFRNPVSDTLLIIQRRIEESDLRTALVKYNAVFAKTDGAEITDLCNSAVAFIQIKCLVDGKSYEFTPRLLRQLIKDYKNQITKVNNIIHLSKVNALTAEEYQKETIRRTKDKNEAFLRSFEEQIVELEKQIERSPIEEKTEEDVQEPKKSPARKEKSKNKSALDGMVSKLSGMHEKHKNQKEVEERLREEEKKQSRTSCEEIPFYDKSLTFTEVVVCKDIPEYSIIKRKNNIYFGLTEHVGKTSYDNRDGSLIELTKATQEFVQYMTENLLSGEFELKPFSEEEKRSMQMYFNFISKCFEQHIGTVLSVQEYLRFKEYYNKMVLKMFELERKAKEDYYRAYILADCYSSYMKSYNLLCADEPNAIIQSIVEDQSESLQNDIDLIVDHHIVDVAAREDLEELKGKIRDFHKPVPEQVVEEKIIEDIPKVTEKTKKEIQQVPVLEEIRYLPQMMQRFPVYQNGRNLEVMQIVIQILNQNQEVVDEALYAGNNIKQALYDYATRDAYIKKLGFRQNGEDVFYQEDRNE